MPFAAIEDRNVVGRGYLCVGMDMDELVLQDALCGKPPNRHWIVSGAVAPGGAGVADSWSLAVAAPPAITL
ncbi:MAG: hypothetical protein WAO69_14510 [Aestuariivita sp.]|uniref:hypothetical protein n=1 Tax=Aestuariivita sp. TaxID=1872407 RepID=UPI003BB0E530